jgi:hypothetical protein
MHKIHVPLDQPTAATHEQPGLQALKGQGVARTMNWLASINCGSSRSRQLNRAAYSRLIWRIFVIASM